ncbi:MAG: SUMF1/EgtB/PvdO family nonheme iron enzyme [Anaerolineales bacterium]|nr:SUMF1/EgtB/PvdO family nonheme iron enzyme [Anaerolineales bacterium]
MNKEIIKGVYVILALLLALTACGPKAAAPTEAAQTEAPPPAAETEAPATEAPAQAAPVKLTGPELGTTMKWVDGSLLVYIPEGEFIMGADGADNPEHVAALSSFWIYRNEVTNRMYAACIASGSCIMPLEETAVRSLENPYMRDRPVVGVNWEQADAYCKWAQGALPTEAQWEKTARGPEGNIYPWGEAAPGCDLLNMAGCLGKTTRVYDYPNGQSYYQVLDMAGNVFEWTNDWYDKTYYQTGPAENPPGPQDGENRSVRGSSYRSGEADTPSSQRFFLSPGTTEADLGFRCVVENPVYYPPYCVTSGYARNPAPGNPYQDCEIDLSMAGQDCGFATADLAGGTITSVEAGEPLNCGEADGTRIYCSGPSAASGTVTVCARCESVSSSIGTADLVCETGYSLNDDGACVRETGGEDGCFRGTELPGTDGLCRPGNSSGGGIGTPELGGGCPIGSYFDTGLGDCVSRTPPVGECLPGYEYDPELMCCEAPLRGTRPGCGPDEYEDTSDGACYPLQNSELGGAACESVYLSMGVCNQRSGSRGPGCVEIPGCVTHSMCGITGYPPCCVCK